ncbi:MAG: hypothetical protein JNL57_05370 [Bacteroidetes bacterium]|nr:hypothetical protein [Bacteroidota bacterium]
MKKLQFIFVLLFCWIQIRAGHSAGGEITWKSLGGTKYTIIAKIYRDCRGISMSSPEFGFFAGKNGDKSCGLQTLGGFTRTSIKTISTWCKTGKDPCYPQNTGGTGEGMELHTWEKSIDLTDTPFSKYYKKSGCPEMGFYMSMCCRPGSINTGIGGSNFTTIAIMNIANLEKCVSKINTSPIWTRNPVLFICCNSPFYYNPGVTDSAENDMVKFRLVPALSDPPNKACTYSTPFSYLIPFTPYCTPNTVVNCTPVPFGKTPKGFFADSITGDIIFTPTKCDEFSVLVQEAIEYRKDSAGNWLVIGQTRRENQFIVIDNCGYNKPPAISGNYKYVVAAGDKICIQHNIVDELFSPNQKTKDTAIAEWSVPLKNASVTVTRDTSRNKFSIEMCWQTSSSDASPYPYVYSIGARDDNCSKSQIASKGIVVQVSPKDSAWFTVSKLNCNRISFSAFTKSKNKYSPLAYWKVTDSATGALTGEYYRISDTTLPAKKGTLKIVLSLSSSDYYYAPVTKFIRIANPEPLVEITKDTHVCLLQKCLISSSVKYATAPYVYNWYTGNTHAPGDTLADFQTLPVTKKQNYTLSVTDSKGCIFSGYTTVTPRQLPVVAWTNKTPATFCANSDPVTLEPFATPANKKAYRIWSSDGNIDSLAPADHQYIPKKINNQSIHPDSAYTPAVYLQYADSFGCIATDTGYLRIHAFPEIQLRDTSVCQNTGDFRIQSILSAPKNLNALYYNWNCIQAPAGVDKYNCIDYKNDEYWLYPGTKGDNAYSGTYLLRFVAEHTSTGCKNQDTASVTLKPQPVLSVVTMNEVCEGKGYLSLLPAVLKDGQTPEAGDGSFTLTGYSKNQNRISSTKLKDGYLMPKDSAAGGTWTAMYTASKNGCQAKMTFSFAFAALPVAAFTCTPDSIAPSGMPYFDMHNASRVKGNEPLNHQWNGGTGQTLSTAFEPRFTYPDVPASYKVQLISTTLKNCADTFSRILRVTGTNGVYSLHNSGLIIHTNGTMEFKGKLQNIEIFRTDGRMVWSYRGQLENGAHIPDFIPNGTYLYRCGRSEGKQTQQENGRFVLLR